MPRSVLLLALGALSAVAPAQIVITDIGRLQNSLWSSAESMSRDGSTVVGSSSDGRAIRWSRADGLESLGTLPGDLQSYAASASDRGSVISGWSLSPARTFRAFRWSRATGMLPLGTLPGWPESSAGAISANGSTIVGAAMRSSGSPPYYRAFRWTLERGLEDLGILPGGTYSYATSLSADGLTVAGAADIGPESGVTFRWSSNGGLHQLPVACENGGAQGGVVSSDGSVIAGDALCPEGTVASRWTFAQGLSLIGPPAGSGQDSHVWGINRDGSIIVGYTNTPNEGRAAIWTPLTGMVELQPLLESHGADFQGLTLRFASAVSDDGLAISANADADGDYHALHIQLPCPFIISPTPPQVVCLLGSARFDIFATGPGRLTYQWRRAGADLEDGAAIAGAHTPSLSISGLLPGDEGLYDCLVTSTCGAATSTPIHLVVCTGDFNCDGGFDGADIDPFFDAWSLGAPTADINADGGVDGADVQAFYERWEQGRC